MRLECGLSYTSDVLPMKDYDSDINSQSQNWTETKQIRTILGETTQLMDQADRHTPVTLPPPPAVCVHMCADMLLRQGLSLRLRTC